DGPLDSGPTCRAVLGTHPWVNPSYYPSVTGVASESRPQTPNRNMLSAARVPARSFLGISRSLSESLESPETRGIVEVPGSPQFSVLAAAGAAGLRDLDDAVVVGTRLAAGVLVHRVHPDVAVRRQRRGVERAVLVLHDQRRRRGDGIG